MVTNFLIFDNFSNISEKKHTLESDRASFMFKSELLERYLSTSSLNNLIIELNLIISSSSSDYKQL
jgi:hypothetical protein